MMSPTITEGSGASQKKNFFWHTGTYPERIPLNRAGNLVFNAAERDNPHMKRLEEQFLLFDDGLPAPADGPDAVEGAFFVAQQKMAAIGPGAWTVGARPHNPKRM